MLKRKEKWPQRYLKIRNFLDDLVKKEGFKSDLNAIRTKYDIPEGSFYIC